MARPTGESKILVALKIIFDVFIFLAGVAVMFVMFAFVEPYKRGFFCNDASISLQKHEDTVKNKQLLYCGVGIPITLIVLLELYTKVIQGRHCGGRLKQCFISSLKLSSMFLYGILLTLLITTAIKLISGRLRPHFLETCQIDLDFYNCTDRYISQFECADDVHDSEIADARSSFPSGHASLAFFSATFLVIYIEDRLTLTFSVLLKSLVQVLIIISAIFVSVSRVNDNRHHPSDVVAGGLLGVIVSVYTVVCISHHFRHESALAPSGGGQIVSNIELTNAYRRQKSLGADSTATGKSSQSDSLMPI